MHESILMKKKAVSNGLVMALDFEGSWVTDSVVPGRSFVTVGSGGTSSVATDQAKNGTKSLVQLQANSQGSGYITTARTTDLTFPGDYWMESWGYCLGQGNATFTGGFNTLFSYGAYSATGGVWRWHLDNLKPSLRIPSGTTDVLYFTSSITVANNAWYHYALGRSGSTTFMFVNGALAASSAGAMGTVGFGSNFNISGYNDARNSGSTYAGFNGYMDRVRIYNYCLYTSAFTPGTGLYPN